MSDIQRWHLNGLPGTAGMVEVMLVTDHVAAVAAAENEMALFAFNRALDKAREAADVALLGTLQTTRDRVLAAIDGVRGGKR